MRPVQRTEKVSGPISGAGAPFPQSKSIVESTRVSFFVVKFMLSKYSASRPVELGAMTVMLTGCDFPVKPAASVAKAVISKDPLKLADQSRAKGALVLSPNFVSPLKNSTQVIAPLVDAAWAVRRMVAGA